MSYEEQAPIRSFVYTVVEDDGVNVTIEIAEEDLSRGSSGWL